MTVKEIIEILDKYPPDAVIVIAAHNGYYSDLTPESFSAHRPSGRKDLPSGTVVIDITLD